MGKTIISTNTTRETNVNINNTLEEGYGKKLHKIWTSLELRKAKEMREEGNTYKEIAEKLGRNAKGVSQRLYRYEGRYNRSKPEII